MSVKLAMTFCFELFFWIIMIITITCRYVIESFPHEVCWYNCIFYVDKYNDNQSRQLIYLLVEYFNVSMLHVICCPSVTLAQSHIGNHNFNINSLMIINSVVVINSVVIFNSVVILNSAVIINSVLINKCGDFQLRGHN